MAVTSSCLLRWEPMAGRAASPVVVTPRCSGLALSAASSAELAPARELLARHGALLFRDFHVEDIAAFQALAARFGHPLLQYDFASTPRSEVGDYVYSSTEYPSHQAIPLHSEQSYCRTWPMKLWFHAKTVAHEGGETPLADCRAVYRCVPERIRTRLRERELLYVRNFGNGLDLPWSRVFHTERRDVVEAYCRAHEISFLWKDDGELRTWQRCQAVARHPMTGESVWFNQANLFHVSSLEVEVREALLEAVDAEDLPRNVYYGDGQPLEEGLLDEVREALAQCELVFPWQQDDVLMLDNMLMAHARKPYRGERKVVVAMAQPYTA